MYYKTILCLADSRKNQGHCVAGKAFSNRILTSEWVRPISARSSHEVSECEKSYENGTAPSLLDVIEIALVEPRPLLHQTENHLLHHRRWWVKKRQASWPEVTGATDPDEWLFWAHTASTYHGLNDKIAEAHLQILGKSLRLIRVPQASVLVRREQGYEGNPSKRRVRVHFEKYSRHHLLPLTDTVLEAKYLDCPDGEYQLEDAIMCISQAELWHGYSFRVVASLLTQERCHQINAA
ncbi:hypothetical protein SIL81_03785 [Xanthomonas campestris pv. incanae]|uniref:dual OB domain-containing protein n=1 Tax=Xanthomonas campestris TaxID=339 RepID=UPI0029C3AB4B|nr:hypothetical protein [Xanthomonas campestris]MDX6081468.1 hypothetical protein [Xanthomonas campestris pv. incanae]MDX6084528.1 hypothetical protein [Xanthomonas campestris pv. incanae]MDX6138349.1 hypothetical protein [Xanthomonas campestris pv. incanae]